MSPETTAAIRAVTDALQVVVLLVVLCVLALGLDAWRRWRRARAFLIGLLTLAGHSVVFYVGVLFDLTPPSWISLWSATLRLHGNLFILATLVVFYSVMLSPGWGNYYGLDDRDGDDGD